MRGLGLNPGLRLGTAGPPLITREQGWEQWRCLDQLPTLMPTRQGDPNQTRVLPPKKSQGEQGQQGGERVLGRAGGEVTADGIITLVLDRRAPPRSALTFRIRSEDHHGVVDRVAGHRQQWRREEAVDLQAN